MREKVREGIYDMLAESVAHCYATVDMRLRSLILSRLQLKAKFFDFLDENRLIFVLLRG